MKSVRRPRQHTSNLVCRKMLPHATDFFLRKTALSHNNRYTAKDHNESHFIVSAKILMYNSSFLTLNVMISLVFSSMVRFLSSHAQKSYGVRMEIIAY